MKRFPQSGFSLVEIAVALGVVAFGLLTVIALLPLGVQSNKISAEETRAAMILTMLEADLRNSLPSATPANSKSLLFGLRLPYQLDSNNHHKFNTSLPAVVGTSVPADCTTGLDDAEMPIGLNTNPRPKFQVSVIYMQPPATGAIADLQARLIVSWPAIPTVSPNVVDLTNSSKVSGYLESFVSFPAP